MKTILLLLCSLFFFNLGWSQTPSNNCPDGKCFSLADYSNVDDAGLERLEALRASVLNLPEFHTYPQLARIAADFSDLIGRIKAKRLPQ